MDKNLPDHTPSSPDKPLGRNIRETRAVLTHESKAVESQGVGIESGITINASSGDYYPRSGWYMRTVCK